MPLKFRSEKIPRNKLGTVFVILGEKVLLSRNSVCLGISSTEIRNEVKRNRIPRRSVFRKPTVFFIVPERFGTSFLKIFLSLNGLERNSECFSLLRNGSERNIKYFCHPQNGSEQNYEVPIVYIFCETVLNFRGMARNGIPSFFRSAKQTEFRRNKSKFPSVPSVFRGIIVFSENGYPS